MLGLESPNFVLLAKSPRRRLLFCLILYKVIFVQTKKQCLISKKHTDTKQSNKRNNQDSKDKRQDYNMK